MSGKYVLLVTSILVALLTITEIVKGDCRAAEELLLSRFSNRDEQRKIVSQLHSQTQRFEVLGIVRSYCEELLLNLQDKFRDDNNPLKFSSNNIIRQAILYEGFRLDTYLSAGVAPKRYFGFFDEQGDSADFERVLRLTIIEAVRIANELAAEHRLKIRISEKEVAVTFLAEGGALLLTNPEDSMNRVHPVRGLGLDDYRAGFSRFPDLIKRFDQFFGTKLGNLVVPFIGKSLLLRPMTFREGVLGTTLMYLYEKEIAARKMRREWGKEMMDLPAAEQFITTSLVYNSGLLFTQERVQQIKYFATAEYLAALNESAKRPKLPVYSREESLERLKNYLLIPKQLTSWSAVYHILQRYGAWIALEQFSDVFKDEAFTNINSH